MFGRMSRYVSAFHFGKYFLKVKCVGGLSNMSKVKNIAWLCTCRLEINLHLAPTFGWVFKGVIHQTAGWTYLITNNGKTT